MILTSVTQPAFKVVIGFGFNANYIVQTYECSRMDELI